MRWTPHGQVLDLLGARCTAEGVTVGAVNAPRQTVLAGPAEELARVEEALTAQGLTSRRVRALDPFHSPVMDDAARRFEKAVAQEELRLPRIPVRAVRPGAGASPAAGHHASRPRPQAARTSRTLAS